MKVNLYLRNNSCLTVTVQQSTLDSFMEALVMADIKGSSSAVGIWRFGDFVQIDEEYIRYTDIVHFREAK